MFIGGERRCWREGQARFKVKDRSTSLAWGQKFKSGWVGFGLMTSYIIYNLLHGPNHEFSVVQILSRLYNASYQISLFIFSLGLALQSHYIYVINYE